MIDRERKKGVWVEFIDPAGQWGWGPVIVTACSVAVVGFFLACDVISSVLALFGSYVRA